MKVHIVIPLYNGWEMCHNLLWNLYRKEKENIASVLIVDDASTDEEVKTGLNWWKAEWKEKADPMPIKVLTSFQNQGFLKSSNLGLRYYDNSPDDIVILLSTDVIINGKFISQICDIINENSSSLVGGVLYNFDTGWNKFENRLFPYLEGWLLATTVHNWEQLDYFDEQFSPSDYEDIDLSTKAISMGMDLVPLNNVGVFHLGGKSIGYSPARMTVTTRNKGKFRIKWIG